MRRADGATNLDGASSAFTNENEILFIFINNFIDKLKSYIMLKP